MGKSDSFIGILIITLKVASWLGSGMLAWGWVEPEGFFGFVLFILSWGVLGKIFDFLIVLILTSVLSK